MNIEERRKKEEKNIVIEGIIILVIAVAAAILISKVFYFDRLYSKDIYLHRSEGATIEERIQNSETYYVDIKRQKIVKGTEESYYDDSSGETKIGFKKTSEKKLTDEEIMKIIDIAEGESSSFSSSPDDRNVAYYTIEYNKYKIFVGGDKLNYIDNIVKGMK